MFVFIHKMQSEYWFPAAPVFKSLDDLPPSFLITTLKSLLPPKIDLDEDKTPKKIGHYSIPRLLFIGPCGSGKTTRVRLFLHELYPLAKLPARIEKGECTTNSGILLRYLVFVHAKYWIEITPSNHGSLHDRDILNSALTNFRNIPHVVIHKADQLSVNAQQYLRRKMETTESSFILIASSASAVFEPLRTRCMIGETYE